ncbi:MAG: glycerate kinase [Phycisphaeraceae bacterium]|nr:glycerate kinase [Phycisphaeraceae bacterium]
MLCAPDSFKDALPARVAAEAMAEGVRAAGGEPDICPVADGGEGTVDAVVSAAGGERIETEVAGPLGQSVTATWGLIDGPAGVTAVIEMAAASGLERLEPGQRDPEKTTTLGTGELIRAALDHGVERILVGIGGSATCDGGTGMAAALGVKFFDEAGQALGPAISGGQLRSIARIESTSLDSRLADVELVVACDVNNPLCGDQGAARIYGPQKGASPEAVERLEQGLRQLAERWRCDLGRDVAEQPGAGAAGGLGGGLVAFLDARLQPGIELVLEAVDFAGRVDSADLCLTGEGCLDRQSLAGKACLGVARAASRAGVKTVALVGAAGEGAEECLAAGLAEYYVIGEGLAPEQSIRRAGALLTEAATEAVDRWKQRLK